MTYDDLPSPLPIFPLDNTLLLPNGVLPLHIFEPRYIRMIDDALASHRCIGIVQPNTLMHQKHHKDAVMTIGCMGRITQFSEIENDRYIIMLKGVSRFEIDTELDSILPYRQITPNWQKFEDDIVEDCDTIQIDRESFLPLLKQYLDVHHIDSDWTVIQTTPCETLLTTLPMICPFDSQEKQMLLESKTLDKRYEILSSLIKMGLQLNSDNIPIRH